MEEVQENTEEKLQISPADKVLEEAKGKFESVLVVGLEKGSLSPVVSTTTATYMFINWLLNRTVFEVNLHETSMINAVNNKDKEDAISA